METKALSRWTNSDKLAWRLPRDGLTIGQTGQIPGASRLSIKTLLYCFFMFLSS